MITFLLHNLLYYSCHYVQMSKILLSKKVAPKVHDIFQN